MLRQAFMNAARKISNGGKVFQEKTIAVQNRQLGYIRNRGRIWMRIRRRKLYFKQCSRIYTQWRLIFVELWGLWSLLRKPGWHSVSHLHFVALLADPD
jgi:hypothetical protein